MKANEDILENILKERRIIRAKMLHKALARTQLKTREESEQESIKESEREFFSLIPCTIDFREFVFSKHCKIFPKTLQAIIASKQSSKYGGVG